MSISPTGRPAASTTGSSLILRSAMTATASTIIAPTPTLSGWLVITSRIGLSRLRSRRCSNKRARSLSVKMPESLPSGSTSIVAPVRRPGTRARTSTSRTVWPSGATRHCSSGRMCCSTLLSFCPRLPAGWKRAKSSRPKFRMRLVTSARASPTASIAVVLLLGARPSGQASSTGPSSRTTRAARPSVLSARPVMAMIGKPNSASGANSRRISAVSPLWERIKATSSAWMRPRSPWTASAGWRQWLGVPVDASVAMIFWPTRPALPMPETITLPRHW